MLQSIPSENIKPKRKRPAAKLSDAGMGRVPAEKDDTLMTRDEFFAKIDQARAQTGGTVIRTKEEMDAFFSSL